ncbi:PREDICTED: mpv17-like protein [Cyprinodon variegatus]|uniref:mpv17-like protein n=1 Tax=Cyprinodon variegatus TaxID=28743 RepID=UPI00074258C9|nr:PREDICTED: mpv17-like protein [Cyprinodon variegatus]
MRRTVLKEAAKRFPWVANVTLYGCLFAGGDLAHQLIAQRERIDWKHTRNVAIVAITFQGNFNYFWLRALEKRFPGKSAGMVFRKLLLDQSFASPLATSVFYTGVSFLEGKEDIFEDWREKFFNTWRLEQQLGFWSTTARDGILDTGGPVLPRLPYLSPTGGSWLSAEVRSNQRPQ